MAQMMQWLTKFSFAGFLIISNLFMTFAWYGTLKSLSHRPWWQAALLSWFVAFFEYMLAVPANRIGLQYWSFSQLKITQEVIALSVFIPFSIWYLGVPFQRDYLWAGLCLLGAVYFMFRP